MMYIHYTLNEHPQHRKCKRRKRNKYGNSIVNGDVIVPLNNLTSWNESNIKWVGSVVDIAVSGIMCVRRRWIYIESKRGDWKCTEWNRSISGWDIIVSILMWYWLFSYCVWVCGLPSSSLRNITWLYLFGKIMWKLIPWCARAHPWRNYLP